jgi:hypothetical protein
MTMNTNKEQAEIHWSRGNFPCTGPDCPVCKDLAALKVKLDKIKEDEALRVAGMNRHDRRKHARIG